METPARDTGQHSQRPGRRTTWPHAFYFPSRVCHCAKSIKEHPQTVEGEQGRLRGADGAAHTPVLPGSPVTAGPASRGLTPPSKGLAPLSLLSKEVWLFSDAGQAP